MTSRVYKFPFLSISFSGSIVVAEAFEKVSLQELSSTEGVGEIFVKDVLVSTSIDYLDITGKALDLDKSGGTLSVKKEKSFNLTLRGNFSLVKINFEK